MTPLLLALLLGGKPAQASRGPTLEAVRAAVGKADAGCRLALEERLPGLEAALPDTKTTKGREMAQQRLMEVMSAADSTGCSDAVRRALAELRRGIAEQQAGSVPPPTEAPDYRAAAVNYLLVAEGEEVSKACAAAARPAIAKWLAHLRTKRPGRPLVKELKAKARALEKRCPEEVTERIAAAAVAISADE